MWMNRPPYSSLPIYLPIIFYWLHMCSFYLPWCLSSERVPLLHLSRGLAQPWAQNKHLTHNWFMIVRHSDSRWPLSYSRPGQVGPSRFCFPGVATADRRGHAHFGAARNCDSWDHGRHPAAGRLGGEQGAGRAGMGRHVCRWPRGRPGWPVPESPAL